MSLEADESCGFVDGSCCKISSLGHAFRPSSWGIYFLFARDTDFELNFTLGLCQCLMITIHWVLIHGAEIFARKRNLVVLSQVQNLV